MAAYENPDFLRLPPGVDALFAAAGESSFFSQAAWYDLLARHGVTAGTQSRLYVDGEQPCHAALVCQVARDRGGAERRRLRSLSSYYSCEHAPLLARTGGEAAIARIVEEIDGERPSWDAIVLAGLDPNDRSFGFLAHAFRAHGLAVKPFFDSGTWYEETRGFSFADYLAERPSLLRNTLRRKSARLKRENRLRWRFCEGQTDLEEGIADYEAVYRASWKRAEPFPRFVPALMRLAAERGALRLGVVHCDGQPAAAQCWILWHGRACIYKLAHDERFDELSLGTLLTMRMMERVLDGDRPAEINFGRGDDPYKKLWLPKRRERWGLTAANPRTLRGLYLTARQAASGVVRRFRSGRPPPPPL